MSTHQLAFRPRCAFLAIIGLGFSLAASTAILLNRPHEVFSPPAFIGLTGVAVYFASIGALAIHTSRRR